MEKQTAGSTGRKIASDSNVSKAEPLGSYQMWKFSFHIIPSLQTNLICAYAPVPCLDFVLGLQAWSPDRQLFST